MDLNQLPQPIIEYCCERISKDIAKFSKDKNELDEDIKTLKADTENLDADTKALNKDIDTLKEDMEKPDADAESLNKEIETLKKNVEKLGANTETLNKDIEKLKGDIGKKVKKGGNLFSTSFLYSFLNQEIGGKPFRECMNSESPESKLILDYLKNPGQTQSIFIETKQFFYPIVVAKVKMYLSNIGNIKISTHPEKFVNPTVAIFPVMADCAPARDGYVRTGNINTQPDFYGNSSYMETMDFFSTEIDGKNVFSHLREKTDVGKTIYQNLPDPESAEKAFDKAIATTRGTISTSTKLKQVYFPVEDGVYHLLTPLTNPSLMFDLKQIFKEKGISMQKDLWKERNEIAAKEGEYLALSYYCIMKYGSTQPQNISLRNSKEQGIALLIPSLPPTIVNRSTRIPRHDFFSESIHGSWLRDQFGTLKSHIAIEWNNKNIRGLVQEDMRNIIDSVAEIAHDIRNQIAALEYEPKSGLKNWQKKLLYPNEDRSGNEWFEAFKSECSRWFAKEYEHFDDSNDTLRFSNDEMMLVEKIIDEEREAFA